MTLIGNSEGKLHVNRQIEDYALRGVEFEAMGFLTFIVETYERRITTASAGHGNEIESYEGLGQSTRNSTGRYLTNHPRSTTHARSCRSENHNFLPNIVGPWLPRRDGDENMKEYYFASILTLLKPWRDLRCLKNDDESWEVAYDAYLRTATRRDRDVVAGCQYYYDSRTSVEDKDMKEEIDRDVFTHYEEGEDVESENVNVESSTTSVSRT